MTTAEVTPLLPTEEPESINFQDSLRFFRQQLAEPSHFQVKSSPPQHVERFVDGNPEYANDGGPKCCRISIPTVDSILESVRVLRAIQKNQKVKESINENLVDEENYSKYPGVQELLLKADGILNSLNPTDSRENNFCSSNNNHEKSSFWPTNSVDTQELSSSSNAENLEQNNCFGDTLKYISNTSSQIKGTFSNQVKPIVSKDKNTENNDFTKPLSNIVLLDEHRTESVSDQINPSILDNNISLDQNKLPDKALVLNIDTSKAAGNPSNVVRICELDDLQTECVPELVDVAPENTTRLKDPTRKNDAGGESLSDSHPTCCESPHDPSSVCSVFINQFLNEESSPVFDDSQERDSGPAAESVHRTEDISEPPEEEEEDEPQTRCEPLSRSGDENIPESTKERLEGVEEASLRKLITSSWDLVSIVKLLFTVGELQSPKVLEEGELRRRVFILSRGAFLQHSEGFYTLLFKERRLFVLEAEEVVLPLTHAEIRVEGDCSIVVDDKMGKCLHLKCESEQELQMLSSELHVCRFKSLPPECIHLVHYPLRCHQNVVIIDLGSCSTRAGILMDQPTLPTLFFPSVCATNKLTGEHVYGLAALEPKERQNATISFPLRPSAKIIKHSVDVDQVTGIFKKIFEDLRIDPADYAILVCLPRSLSISVQSAIVDVLLRGLNVRAVSLSHQAILTLYAHNASTGIVLDIGDRMDVLPVIDGFVVEGGVTRLPYGGQRLIHHMKHALAQKHISLSNDIDSFVVEYISEKLSYVAEDYEKEASLHPHTLRKAVDLRAFARDENCLKSAVLDDARFKVPEGLFNPDLWGLDFPGVHHLVEKAIQAAGVDARKRVAENIYLSGGLTLIPGFVERLAKEVTRLNEPRITPRVFASSYRRHCTFIGACRLAAMDAFPQVCLTLDEYSRDGEASLKKFTLCV